MRDRIDQARRLSLHQQTVRAGRITQPDRESPGKTIARARDRTNCASAPNSWRSLAGDRRDATGVGLPKTKSMQEIHELINAMAPSEANVLITGESGVGKEVIANVIHSRSRRADKPMVKLNCAAFPQTMIESELFGYVKGAFTGAANDFPGMIAEAGPCTLFPRRNFRDADGIADAFSACLAGTGISLVRQHENFEGRFSRDRRDKPGPSRRRWRRRGCARIFITASTRSRSKCRPCANGAARHPSFGDVVS